MSALVQPRLVNGPFGDPVLYLDFRFERRAILFDIGAFAPREILRVSHAFVSHAHMHHLSGLDRLLRLRLHTQGTLHLAGPRGFVDQIEHRLRSYTWNLVDDNSTDFRLQVAEFDGRTLRRACLRARDAFRRWDVDTVEARDGVILSEEGLSVAACLPDHGTPSAAFALRETQRINVWRSMLDEIGLPVGPWLNEAKAGLRRGCGDAHVLSVPGHGTISLGILRERTPRVSSGDAIAYVTDAADHEENRARIASLATGAQRLFLEAVYLSRDRSIAKATRHLPARAAGEIARRLKVRSATPFHHSPRYLETSEAPEREFRRAFAADEVVA
ncbi:MBL fold metallo-hydrolase [Roseitranquillus sediminis]|uniref:hypothetical protein n=1 Tax=Roseitranquillus sediminis TaxID=2809051 RepID=UPI001D0C7FA8|nr:hypothetical protein [Roseitranquillus sediminis]MBM9596465.1 hypothetical protein [Roseitranquillus sediminis]